MDVSLLRRALRLVHCLQKERGASCAVCASNVGFPLPMQQARASTDIVARRLFQEVPPALAKIRTQLDQGATTQVHRMLVIFNTLIAHVVHTYILQYLLKSRRSRDLQRLEEEQGGRGHYRARSESADAFSTQQHRYQSDNLVPEFLVPHAKVAYTKQTDFIQAYSDPSMPMPSMRGVSPPTGLLYSPQTVSKAYSSMLTPPLTMTKEYSIPLSPCRQKMPSNFIDESQDRMVALLNLLACLVRLKESTGMQRAVISSIVPGSDSHMLVTSLILEVENQRKLVAELQQLPLFDYSLQKLVKDSVTMGPQMEMLQAKILKDFDLQGFQQARVQ